MVYVNDMSLKKIAALQRCDALVNGRLRFESQPIAS
jgi:hypothetical protein